MLLEEPVESNQQDEIRHFYRRKNQERRYDETQAGFCAPTSGRTEVQTSIWQSQSKCSPGQDRDTRFCQNQNVV